MICRLAKVSIGRNVLCLPFPDNLEIANYYCVIYFRTESKLVVAWLQRKYFFESVNSVVFWGELSYKFSIDK